MNSFGLETVEAGRLLDRLGLYLKIRARFRAAELAYERALAIRKQILAPEHLDLASSLNNLAMLHKEQGDYRRAIPLCERALTIRERALGGEHLLVALNLNSLATLHQVLGEYSRALPLSQRALAIWEKALPEHPGLATALENYASLLSRLGRHDEADEARVHAKRILDEHAGKNPNASI